MIQINIAKNPGAKLYSTSQNYNISYKVDHSEKNTDDNLTRGLILL